MTDQTTAPYDAGVRHGRRLAAEAIRSRLRDLLLAEACCTRRDCPNPACRSVRREAWTLAEAIALAEDRELRSPRDEIREEDEERPTVHVETVVEYAVELTYPDGTAAWCPVGPHRDIAEALAASPARWQAPGRPGVIHQRTVTTVVSPWQPAPTESEDR